MSATELSGPALAHVVFRADSELENAAMSAELEPQHWDLGHRLEDCIVSSDARDYEDEMFMLMKGCLM